MKLKRTFSRSIERYSAAKLKAITSKSDILGLLPTLMGFVKLRFKEFKTANTQK